MKAPKSIQKTNISYKIEAMFIPLIITLIELVCSNYLHWRT